MSTLKVTTLQDTAGSNSSTAAEIFSGRAKVWVNFNGQGTVAIRADYNVNSITDNRVGDYTVNFSSSLADANYSFTQSAADSALAPYLSPLGSGNFATGSIRFDCWTYLGGRYDTSSACVAIFR